MPEANQVCKRCGNKISNEGLQGLCGVCLFKTGLRLLSVAGKATDATVAQATPKLEDYELLEEIGRGGQGVVYRAQQKSLNRTVALKIIGAGAWATETHLRRFRMEAEAAARLNHPRIVSIYEINESEGCCYFSMRLVDGSPLDDVIQCSPMPPREAATLMGKVARTVHFAHEHGILHRDIKPGNILVDEDGEPHLTDFGLARLVESNSTVTRSTDVLGTPSYIAPEQAGGNNAADARLTPATDIYALGAVLYQLLTGQPPFAGATTYETVRLVMETEPRSPRLLNRRIDRDLCTICLKCLEKEPHRRYPTALELGEDLECWLSHKPIRARPTGLLIRGHKWFRRNRAAAIAAIALLALAATLGLTLWRSERPQPPLSNGVAVLPFENLTESKENAFLAGGIHEELLSDLSKISGLKVISRTSVMRYKGDAARNLKEVARQLGVDHIIEGSVSRAANRIRVSVQLIDARTDTHLWSQKYDRDVGDALTIQSEIAEQIASQLKTQLSPEERAALAERLTKDPIAYTLYAKAREMDAWEDWGGDEKTVAEQIGLLEKATQRDPHFVLAWCALARARDHLASLTGDGKQFNLVKEAAENAVKLRPDMGEPHLALARYYWTSGVSGRGYDRARQESAIARSKLPNNPEPFIIEAMIQRHENRWDSAIANLERASELDPGNSEIIYRRWEAYFLTRRYHNAEQVIAKSMEDDKLAAKVHLAFISLAKGDAVGAQSLLDQVPLDYAPRSTIWDARLTAALYRRDNAAISRGLTAMPPKWLDLTYGGDSNESLSNRLVALTMSDKQKALAMFATARQNLEQQNSERDEVYFGSAASLDAMLGRKEAAIREAKRALELRSIANDSLNGPWIVTNLARVYASTGEPDRALEQLEIVATIPCGPTYGDLLLNPCWDSLRGNNRFNAIIARAKAAGR